VTDMKLHALYFKVWKIFIPGNSDLTIMKPLSNNVYKSRSTLLSGLTRIVSNRSAR